LNIEYTGYYKGVKIILTTDVFDRWLTFRSALKPKTMK